MLRKSEARANYDRLSRWYDALFAPAEWPICLRGLSLLQPQEGEVVLEVALGTGRALLHLSQAVGPSGRAVGIDLSRGMLQVAKRRLTQSLNGERVELVCGDAVELPCPKTTFHAVFMSFALELFDTPEIARVVAECSRVLHPGGRMCVVALSKSPVPGRMEYLYERLHRQFPVLFDCRPIRVSDALERYGLRVSEEILSSMWGIPVSIVLATRPKS